jgi:hypothetical protein
LGISDGFPELLDLIKIDSSEKKNIDSLERNFWIF